MAADNIYAPLAAFVVSSVKRKTLQGALAENGNLGRFVKALVPKAWKPTDLPLISGIECTRVGMGKEVETISGDAIFQELRRVWRLDNESMSTTTVTIAG